MSDSHGSPEQRKSPEPSEPSDLTKSQEFLDRTRKFSLQPKLRNTQTRGRKLSLEENYSKTNNPFVLAKQTSIISVIDESEEEEEPEIIVENLNSVPRRKSGYYGRRQSVNVLPIGAPVKQRQRSNTVAFNAPPKLIEDEHEELVDVRDEILFMKEQFDKLCAVIDDDFLPSNPTLAENSDFLEEPKK